MTLIVAVGDRLVGTVVSDKYRIFSPLGGGAWGLVYLGFDLQSEQPVAIKVMRAKLKTDSVDAQRFRREAKIIKRLEHPNIVTVFDSGVLPSGEPFMVMEYLKGTTLEALLRENGALPPERTLDIVLQVLSALEHAHKAGVVHRDIKPDNFLILDNDLTKILDFGLAKPNDASMALTATNETVGSPWYMSPEQCKGKNVDARSDLYSLGMVIYKMLCGKMPYTASNIFEMMQCQINTVPLKPTKAVPGLVLPRELEAVVMLCLEKDPKRRFQTASAMKEALIEITNNLASKNVTASAGNRKPISQQAPPAADTNESAGSPLLKRVWLYGCITIAIVILAAILAALWLTFGNGSH